MRFLTVMRSTPEELMMTLVRSVSAKRLSRLALAIVAAALAPVTAATASASAAPSPSRVVGHVYIDDNNNSGVNTIGAFDRHADGTLTPMRGPPFVAGGLGTPTTTISQGALQLSSDGHYLLAVDRGSNEISVLRIKRDGSLKRVGGGPVSSNGVNPVSIAVYGNLVYVANAGTPTSSGETNYTGFTLNPGGHLRPLAGSTVTLPDGSQLGDVLFSPDGSKLVGTRVGPSLIDSFTVDGDGLLRAATGSPFPAQGLGPFGGEFRPTNPGQLYITNAHNVPRSGPTATVSAFTDSTDGTLTSIGASPFRDYQSAACWVEISRDGQHLFAVNTGSVSISSYSIATDGSLTLVKTTPVNAPTQEPEDARLSPDGTTLWVVDSGGDTVSGFTVDGGSLTEPPTSPTPGPVGTDPIGIVVT